MERTTRERIKTKDDMFNFASNEEINCPFIVTTESGEKLFGPVTSFDDYYERMAELECAIEGVEDVFVETVSSET